MRKFDGISPEILWANKEATLLVLVVLVFGLFVFSFKMRDKTYKGRAIITQIQKEGKPPVKVYTLDIRGYDDPPNKRVFIKKVKETDPIGSKIINKRINQEVRLTFQKAPDGNWMIRHIYPN